MTLASLTLYFCPSLDTFVSWMPQMLAAAAPMSTLGGEAVAQTKAIVTVTLSVDQDWCVETPQTVLGTIPTARIAAFKKFN